MPNPMPNPVTGTVVNPLLAQGASQTATPTSLFGGNAPVTPLPAPSSATQLMGQPAASPAPNQPLSTSHFDGSGYSGGTPGIGAEGQTILRGIIDQLQKQKAGGAGPSGSGNVASGDIDSLINRFQSFLPPDPAAAGAGGVTTPPMEAAPVTGSVTTPPMAPAPGTATATPAVASLPWSPTFTPVDSDPFLNARTPGSLYA